MNCIICNNKIIIAWFHIQWQKHQTWGLAGSEHWCYCLTNEIVQREKGLFCLCVFKKGVVCISVCLLILEFTPIHTSTVYQIRNLKTVSVEDCSKSKVHDLRISTSLYQGNKLWPLSSLELFICTHNDHIVLSHMMNIQHVWMQWLQPFNRKYINYTEVILWKAVSTVGIPGFKLSCGSHGRGACVNRKTLPTLYKVL